MVRHIRTVFKSSIFAFSFSCCVIMWRKKSHFSQSTGNSYKYCPKCDCVPLNGVWTVRMIRLIKIRSPRTNSSLVQPTLTSNNPLRRSWTRYTSSKNCTISREIVNYLDVFVDWGTYPAVPIRTSWVLTFGKLPITNAEISIEKDTVKDVHSRDMRSQRRRNTGISKIPTTNDAPMACFVAV